MTPQDLEQMLRNLENMARSGNRDMAQQMLSQLRDLLDRLQSGRMADQGQSQRFGQMMDEFGNIIGRQQQLLDDTFGQQRQQGQQGQRGQRGQQGQQGQKGQRGQQGQQGEGQGKARATATSWAASAIASASCATCWAGCSAACASSVSMRPDSSAALARPWSGPSGLCATAISTAPRRRKARALEQLRQGAREMAQQMLNQMPSRFGLNDNNGELDPMGRPPQRTDGPDPGIGVKVPDQIDVQRAREILEELRRRLGEPTRPPIELEYLERLLKRSSAAAPGYAPPAAGPTCPQFGGGQPHTSHLNTRDLLARVHVRVFCGQSPDPREIGWGPTQQQNARPA